MIIRRDAMSHTPSTVSSYTAAAATYPSPPPSSRRQPSPNPNEHVTTTTINKLASQEAAANIKQDVGTSASGSAIAHSNGGNTNGPINSGSGGMGPLQQRETMQKETWDKERKQLLQKATNSQGDSVERLLANYLAV